MDDKELADLLQGLSLSTCPNLSCKDTKCFVCHEQCSKCKRDCKCNTLLPVESYIRQPGIFFHIYDKLNVNTSGPDDVRLPDPIGSFQVLKELPPSIIDNKSFYKKPTPIQKYGIPVMMAGLDLVACAQTGSGKTAAFLLPIFAKILSRRKDEGPYALILTPTRELAIQIYQDIKQLTKQTSIKCCCVYGGTDVEKSLRDVNLGFDILVGTPGRVLHFLELNENLLSTIKVLVLDEGDHMLGSNFISELKQLNKFLPPAKERQTALFCATLPEKVTDLRDAVNNKPGKSKRTDFTEILKEFIKTDFIFICVGKVDGSSSLIDQRFIKVQQNPPKIKMLIDILAEEVKEKSKTIVFVETKKETRSLSKFLCQCGFQVTVFHKDRSQTDREYGLHQFNSGIKPIMVCTSVSARGLDIVEVKTVINYDLPRDVSTYIYRIGRTGRAGNRGKSISFFVEGRDDDIARGLVKTLSVSEQDVPEWLEEIAEKCLGTEYGPRAGIFAAKDTRKKVSRQIYPNGPS